MIQSHRTRQKLSKKRSLQIVNEHFEIIFNAVIWLRIISVLASAFRKRGLNLQQYQHPAPGQFQQ